MKKFNSIVFYNNFNKGDLHVVRSFLTYFRNKYDKVPMKLKHPNGNEILKDIKFDYFWKPTSNKFDLRGYYTAYGDVYINTQYLAYNRVFFRKFGATLFTLYSMFNKSSIDIFDEQLSDDILSFLPEIDYDFYDVKSLDIRKNSILICNNDFLSEQAIKFNFNDIIESLSTIFLEKTFYISNKDDNYPIINKENVIYIDDITKNIECNLNEISYISTKCDYIIGRNSGPHTFSYTKSNMLDENKSFISFSSNSYLYGKPGNWIDFGISKLTDKHAKFHNIDSTDYAERLKILIKIIGG